MQNYFFLIFCLILSINLNGQNCFEDLYNKGIIAHGDKHFDEAIAKFKAASICDNAAKHQQEKAIQQMNIAEKDYIAALNTAITDAESSKEEALQAKIFLEQQLIIDKANHKAFLVEKEIERNNFSYALQLASEALKEAGTKATPNILSAYGNAVYHNYTIEPAKGRYYFQEIVSTPIANQFLGLSTTNDLVLWANNGTIIEVIKSHNQHIWSIQMTKDGNNILTASSDSTACIINIATKAKTILKGHQADVLLAIFAPDEQRILTTSRDHSAKIWNLDGEELFSLEGHQANIFKALFSANGQYLLTIGTDKSVLLWDATTGTQLTTFTQHQSFIHTAHFLPDQQHIITSATDEETLIWNFSGKIIHRLNHDQYITACQLSPDNQLILTASVDKTLKLWTQEGQIKQQLLGHQAKIIGATFSPNSQFILSWSIDNSLRLWKNTGKTLQILNQHTAPVTSAIFSPSGKYILSGAQDKTAKLWDLNGNILMNLNNLSAEVKSVAFSTDENMVIIVTKNNQTITCRTPMSLNKD